MLSPPNTDDFMRKQRFQLVKQQAEEQCYAIYSGLGLLDQLPEKGNPTLKEFLADPSLQIRALWMSERYDDVNTMVEVAKQCINATHTPEAAAVYYEAGFVSGQKNDYMSSVVPMEKLDLLNNPGVAMAFFGPTGCGKTKTILIMLELLKKRLIIILTNRDGCKTQLYKDVLSLKGIHDPPQELIYELKLPDNVEIMTYQDFTQKCHLYEGKKVLYMLDEIHSLVEDSTFTVYGEQAYRFFKRNKEYISIAFMSATPDPVIEYIWAIVSDGAELPKLSMETRVTQLGAIENLSSLQGVYYIPPDWSYLKFRTYNPHDTDTLIKHIRPKVGNGGKALYLINDIDQGKAFAEAWGDGCQHIYADEEKRMELREIALNEKSEADVLIVTSIAENGISIHDLDVRCIIAESWDDIKVQQIIGRIRVNKQNPQDIEVLIPDYSLADLGRISGDLYIQIREFEDAIDNLDWTIARAVHDCANPCPYGYYSPITKETYANNMGLARLRNLRSYIDRLREEEESHPHAFVNHILALYGKESYQDELRIDFDNMKVYAERMRAAIDEYDHSDLGPENYNRFRDNVKAICKDTGVKPITTKTFTYETINDRLAIANINKRLHPKKEVYQIYEVDDGDVANVTE